MYSEENFKVQPCEETIQGQEKKKIAWMNSLKRTIKHFMCTRSERKDWACLLDVENIFLKDVNQTSREKNCYVYDEKYIEWN